MNNTTTKDEFTMVKLLSLWLAKLDIQYRRYQNKRLIANAERDLELTKREIAEMNRTRQHFEQELMHLKVERRSLGS